MIYILLGLIGTLLLSLVGFAVFVVSTEHKQYKDNALFPFQENTNGSKTVVAYFSRSKNTEVAAKTIAKHKKAMLLPIEAENYKIGLNGWINANQDARKQKAEINYNPVDFNTIDTLYIGSPIWWYSPAPPIWEFIRSNDLRGTKVILFNTYNSKFEQQYIDDFADSVRAKGGVFMGHIAVNRGRMGQQIDTQELEKQILEQLVQLSISTDL